MSHPDANLRAHVAELLSAVETELRGRGDNTASVAHVVDQDGLVTISVQPRNAEAAAVNVQITVEDAVLLTFGRTTVQLTGSHADHVDQLRTMLHAVFEGSFTEYGPGHAEAHLQLASGINLRVGSTKSPLQRRFGPKHRYAPYD